MHTLLWLVFGVAVWIALRRLLAHRAAPPSHHSQWANQQEAHAHAEPAQPEETWKVRVYEVAAAPEDTWEVRLHEEAATADETWEIRVLETPAAPDVPIDVPVKQPRIELVPRAMHGRNVRAVVGPDIWSLVRNIALKADGQQCVECGATERLECHEEWEYAQAPCRVMKLVRLCTLCHLCHMIKHVGFAKKQGEYALVQAHVEAVYAMTAPEFRALERWAVERVKALDAGGIFALDLTYLNDRRFEWAHHRMGRQFGKDEFQNCVHRAVEDELVS